MSMNVANCHRCGKIYIKNLNGMCPNCVRDIEQQYDKCFKYLREYRSCTIDELNEATEVPVKQIAKFIREGRISIKGNPNMFYLCEVCGAQIREHTICEPCRSRLAKETSQMKEDDKRKEEQQELENQASFKIRDRLQNRSKS